MAKIQTVFRRADMKRDFTVLRNAFLQDGRLSWDMRGMIGEVLSRPADWTVTVPALMASSGYGRDKIRKLVSAAEAFGYMRKFERRNQDGTFIQHLYMVSDDPVYLTTISDPFKPRPENPSVDDDHPRPENPAPENPHPYKEETLYKGQKDRYADAGASARSGEESGAEEGQKADPPPDDGFDDLWKTWPHPQSRKPHRGKAQAYWRAMKPQKREEVRLSVPYYLEEISSGRQKWQIGIMSYMSDAGTKNGYNWRSYLPEKKDDWQSSQDESNPTAMYLIKEIINWLKTKIWPIHLASAGIPGTSGCSIPQWVIDKAKRLFESEQQGEMQFA